ncbi:hypothetical protein GOP47_0031197, partial [Adiantum capillus-veneris]
SSYGRPSRRQQRRLLHSFPRLQETRFSANLDEDACRQVYLSAGGDNETSKEKKGADYADEQLTWQYTRG